VLAFGNRAIASFWPDRAVFGVSASVPLGSRADTLVWVAPARIVSCDEPQREAGGYG
jgi:hypothetical protein